MSEWFHPAQNVRMSSASAMLPSCTLPVLDHKIVTCHVTFLSPDQRVASFCTMTDMQRAEALHISRELTRRVVEAEGAALEAE